MNNYVCSDPSNIGMVLVHGYIHDDIHERVQELIGTDNYPYVIDNEGGYTVTVVTNKPTDLDTVTELLTDLYENEELVDYDNQDLPVYVGTPEAPIHIPTMNHDYEIEFLGGIWGYEEDSCERYQE